jgi:hypothetical protein
MGQVTDSFKGLIEICCVPEDPGPHPHRMLELRSNLRRILASVKKSSKGHLDLLYPGIIYFFNLFFPFAGEFSCPFTKHLRLSKGIAPETVRPVNPPGNFSAGK